VKKLCEKTVSLVRRYYYRTSTSRSNTIPSHVLRRLVEEDAHYNLIESYGDRGWRLAGDVLGMRQEVLPTKVVLPLELWPRLLGRPYRRFLKLISDQQANVLILTPWSKNEPLRRFLDMNMMMMQAARRNPFFGGLQSISYLHANEKR
jgi:hypothetical protein